VGAKSEVVGPEGHEEEIKIKSKEAGGGAVVGRGGGRRRLKKSRKKQKGLKVPR
jgi:hypothetical protein